MPVPGREKGAPSAQMGRKKKHCAPKEFFITLAFRVHSDGDRTKKRLIRQKGGRPMLHSYRGKERLVHGVKKENLP